MSRCAPQVTGAHSAGMIGLFVAANCCADEEVGGCPSLWAAAVLASLGYDSTWLAIPAASTALQIILGLVLRSGGRSGGNKLHVDEVERQISDML